MFSRQSKWGSHMMRDYRYTFFNGQGVLDAALELHSDGDEAACDLASELLSRSKCSIVEVRREAKLIFRIARDGSKEERRDLSQSVAAAE
jgi:hypothetical protein